MKISIINPQEGDEVETKKALKFKKPEKCNEGFSVNSSPMTKSKKKRMCRRC